MPSTNGALLLELVGGFFVSHLELFTSKQRSILLEPNTNPPKYESTFTLIPICIYRNVFCDDKKWV